MINRANCKSCNAVVFWCKTESGKLMPVDAEPTGDGNLVIFDNGNVRAVTGEGRITFAGELHKSHFATCPNSAQHRKAKP